MLPDQQLSNVIRILSIDAIERSKSGHPGMPMGMADIATILWKCFLKHNPKNPNWYDRDRFILSNGHGSMLLYSLLHLTGYDIKINDIKQFRQYKSKTPGHPEVHCTPGVEITTGPLGQGLGNAVGMAIAEYNLSNYFNKIDYKIVDHYTWVFVGDGCLMEGISHESCSLAGTLGLGKLIVFYDNNHISIDGNTKEWFTDDTYQRFKSYNWHVIPQIDGHNFKDIYNAIQKAKKIRNKPSLIICNTIIGFGSPNKSGSHEIHGTPLGDKETSLVRKKLNWNYPPFFIPNKIYEQWSNVKEGAKIEECWWNNFKAYKKEYPKLSQEFIRRMNSKMPENWNNISQQSLKKFSFINTNSATRQSSQQVIEEWAKFFPELIGGSADLAPSNLTKWSGSKSIKSHKIGNYIHYGVREFGMTAIANGISHHGGFIPYTATFLMFFEYAHNAVRMASLMKTKHIFVYTHDSIGLGEDGPTHQPIEQLAHLRLIPNLNVWRPSNLLETAVAWKNSLENNEGPSALILSRQVLVNTYHTQISISNILKGGYILKDFGKFPQIILIATGSELNITLQAAQEINKKGYSVRVVSIPSINVFEKQTFAYKEYVLPATVKKRIAIEAGVPDLWYKYVGSNGIVIGINTFGESASSEKLFQKFGFTVTNIVSQALSM
ncbi:transketolase [Buchnera aphidicola (Nipponaphis monzeni)]|uniref:Transketolase n=1 Tax=Buchnera aphidicola (Nipponaphis monzeni) TaxID=2495405 RepID=A0A455T9U0_9GAMM|nr:transketolase [Buchnera aphidicola]BBI01092.1 transketolase [Buchnera aphidicola (Nipponaphis monzeni)]